MKRQLSFPVSMMSQWWVSRSSIAVVDFGVAEHLRPIGEGEVRGDEQGRVLVKLADQVEQELSAGLAERQIAQLVDDDDVVSQQLLGQPATAAGRLLLFELIGPDRPDWKKRPLAYGRVMTAEATSNLHMMGFACACAADENGVALGVQEGAGGEFANLSLIDRGVGEGERHPDL